MDLPTTQQTANTLKEEIEKYQALYSEYIQCAVDMHNYHQRFIRKPIRTIGPTIRNHIKKMIDIEKKMFKACKSVCAARVADFRARQRASGRIPTLAQKGQMLDENFKIRNIKK
jgi:hypothetical protein